MPHGSSKDTKKWEALKIVKELRFHQNISAKQCQGKWFAMKFLLDTEVAPDNRAVEFSKQQQVTSSLAHDNVPTISEGWYSSWRNLLHSEVLSHEH